MVEPHPQEFVEPVSEIDVRLVDVVKRFGDSNAVDHISLDVKDGEFFSLLGPSGCGKTTTLRMIGGFEQPTSGLIELQGQDVTWLPSYKRNVNTVFQSYALFPHLTIEENVAFPLRRLGAMPPAAQDRHAQEHLGRPEGSRKAHRHVGSEGGQAIEQGEADGRSDDNGTDDPYDVGNAGEAPGTAI